MFNDSINSQRPYQLALMGAFNAFSRETNLRCLQVLELCNITVRYADLFRLWKRARNTMTTVKLNVVGRVGAT